jgi:hypothetical protein
LSTLAGFVLSMYRLCVIARRQMANNQSGKPK